MIRPRDLHATDSATTWPRCSTWDLDQVYRELRAGIVELETAWAEDRLRDAIDARDWSEILGPDLGHTYRWIASLRLTVDPDRRRAVVLALVDLLYREAFHVDHWGRISRFEDLTGGGPRFETWLGGSSEAGSRPPGVVQRLDEIVARRFWGIGFLDDDIGVTDAVTRAAVRTRVARLAVDIHDLTRMMHARPHGELIIPNHEDRRFERLMCDILSEREPCARPARLEEDFRWKIDLRVRYPGLPSARGARIQVKATANRRLLADRLANLRNHDHFVILSPATLAEFVARCQADRSFHALPPEQLAAFWEALSGQPLDIDELAYLIKETLSQGLFDRPRDPRGPMAMVPAGVREVVRAFVRSESFRATRALQAFQQNRN